MFRITIAITALAGLAACGASNSTPIPRGGFAPSPFLFAKGPLQQACQAGGRKDASRSRCGCVQAVADKSLSSADQRRGASLWKDPGRLQEIRQSDAAGNERFWQEWKGFAGEAARLCEDT